MSSVRVRFAPSPTGALHIGGLRTALYNYLLAQKTGGTFILRIEDTDQARYVPGAEEYIIESLKWCGILPTEGPGIGGDYGPYRQSERKDMYGQYAQQLVDSGNAYYAFDSAEELDKMRTDYESRKETFRYDSSTRVQLNNSLTISAEEVKTRLESGVPYVIRLKIPRDEEVSFNDLIRGQITFQSNEVDDKIILKGDGMPTYHLANIVDDYFMKISHVIRGEEWLSSTPHHVYLYRFLGWEDSMPHFAHLPLILKPTGKGKLGKRDGAKFGFPVFPLTWKGETPEDSFDGFREFGFDPKAVLNFLAFLGWNPGTEQEVFSLEELSQAFSIERVGKSGAKFDFEKAKWYNQQYLMAKNGEELAALVRPFIDEKGYEISDDYLAKVCELMKERVGVLPDFVEKGYYFFEGVKEYDEKTIRKRWKPERQESFDQLARLINNTDPFDAAALETAVKGFLNDTGLSFGEVFPILRIAISGTTQGPAVFDMIETLGKTEVGNRLKKAYMYFNELSQTV
ncbi:MAG: glutamyl-tRNA synthetase [Saprospiraceae bacterium]|jgi:glutamyl-tRNA synthetase